MIMPITQPNTPIIAEKTVTANAMNNRAKNQTMILSNIPTLYPMLQLSK